MTVSVPEQEDKESYFFWLHLWRKIIAAVEVIGGVFGLYFVLFGKLIGSSHLIFTIAFLFFALAVVAGVLLAFNENLGVILSLVVQSLQLFQISVTGLLYFLVCGPQFVLGYYFRDGFTLSFSGALMSAFQIVLNGPSVSAPSTEPMGVVSASGPGMFVTGINVIALAAIICLFFVRTDNRNRSGASQVNPAA